MTEERWQAFWAMVERADCWVWRGGLNNGDWPIFNARRYPARVRVHPKMLTWYVETGQALDFTVRLYRTCEEPLCIRPDHHRLGSPAEARAKTREQEVAAFWTSLTSVPCPTLGTDCRVRKQPRGVRYPSLRIQGEDMSAHRWAWTLANGPIPAGLYVCHRCDNPPCCEPAHLFLGTSADNSADMVAKGRAFRGRGTASPNARFTREQVVEMRRIYAAGGVPFSQLGPMFGVTAMTAHHAVRGIRYDDVPGALPSTRTWSTRRKRPIDTRQTTA